MSTCRKIRLLIWKNFKLDLRRPKGLLAELLLPAIILGLLSLARSTAKKNTVASQYGMTKPVFYDYTYKNNATLNNPIQSPQPFIDLTQPLCLKDKLHYLGIVPNTGASTIVDEIVTQMKIDWDLGKTKITNFNATFGTATLCTALGIEFKNISCYPPCNSMYGLEFIDDSVLKRFDSDSTLNSYLKNWDVNDGTKPIGIAIVFDDYSSWDSISYTIRTNASDVPETDNESKIGETHNEENYFLHGFPYQQYVIPLQLWINQIITEKVASNQGINIPDYQFGIFSMPTFEYKTDVFWEFAIGILPFSLIIAFIYPYFYLTGFIVSEKSLKIKEGLKMMGSSNIVYWSSIYIYFGFKFFIEALICTIVSQIGNIFEFSDFSIILIWYTLFLWTLLTSGILISTFFDNPKTASMISIVILFTLYNMFAIMEAIQTKKAQNLMCLIGPACFSFSVNHLAEYEKESLGLKYNNITQIYKHISFQMILIMLIIDNILYIIFAMYFDQVIPSKFGQKLPWYYIFQKHYWFHSKVIANEVKSDEDVEMQPLYNAKYEKVSNHPQITVKLRNIVKQYSMGIGKKPFTAVNKVSLDMYENQIFGLLGHNGAGKTTLINCLSGMLPITEGNAEIKGMNVRNNINSIREVLGICPQHDVLWDSLTVKEHLHLFAAMKGVKRNELIDEVDDMIKKTGMQDKVNNFPTQLSGGQKRKLSLGIALIGGSKVVFLDEPTSGVDPHSRREVWHLIKQCVEGRTIILTTHFLDEADVLSNRIAILAHGNVMCCGSPMFLKKEYGVGYSITFTLINTEKIEKITNLVKQHINNAELLSGHGNELIYRLPFNTTNKFPDMFTDIDNNKDTLNIMDYGLSATTMDEVFLKVGEELENKNKNRYINESINKYNNNNNEYNSDFRKDEEALNNAIEKKSDSESDALNSVDFEEMLQHAIVRAEKNLFLTHLYAILYKKFNTMKRDKRTLICQIFLPIIFMLLGFAFSGIETSPFYEKLNLDMTQFDKFKTEYNPYNIESNNINIFNDDIIWNEIYELNMQGITSINTNLEPYQYNNDTYLTNFKSKLLDISGETPWKFISYYLPIFSNNTLGITTTNIGCGYNVTTLHGLPTSINIASNIALKKIKSTAYINTYIQSFPSTIKESALTNAIAGIIYAANINFALSFFACSIVYNVILEKETSIKHQQLVSGMNSISYWIGQYIFDILSFIPLIIFSIILVLGFNAEAFKDENLGAFTLSLFLYGLCILPFCYLFSWTAKSSTKGQYISLFLFISTGYILGITTFVLDSFDTARDFVKIIVPILNFLPTYATMSIMLNMALIKFGIQNRFNANENVWHMDVTGLFLTYLAILWFVYFGLNILIEYLSTKTFSCIPVTDVINNDTTEIDSDVLHEQKDVQNHVNNGKINGKIKYPIVINGLKKVYSGKDKPNIAVKNLSYLVKRGSVFGFLGTNGAGKTTTLSILTGKYLPTKGTAYINSVPITNQISCRRMIGYCPQFDAICGLLTAIENLIFYGMIKGLDKKQIKIETDTLINKLLLNEYKDKICESYSGGNKRKLSVGIAMIGSPPIVFLDEPSTGMDPISKRHMWDFISSTMHARSVILTTHSMEECENLCDKIGIMVLGELKCIGSSQHLKSKFGKGYQLEVNFDDSNIKNRYEFENALKKEFDCNIIMLEHNYGNYKYKIEASKNKMGYANVFKILETVLPKYNLTKNGYALSQTTLEQIFIQMAPKKEESLQQSADS